MPTAPSPPRMVTIVGTPTGSTVELNWLPPLHPNGAIIRYDIEYILATASGDPMTSQGSSSSYFSLTLPEEFQTYNVRIVAVSTSGSVRSEVFPLCRGRHREGVWDILICTDI